MLSANPFSSRITSAAFILAMIATFGLSLRAQEPPQVHVGDKTITGLPSDWSHRHVIYGDPGTEQNAVSNGTHEQWNRVVNDPRYIIQRLKKDLPVQGPAAQDVEMRHKIGEQERRTRDGWGGRGDRDGRDGRDRRHHKPDPTLVTMHRDWSMKTGGTGASITLTIPPASGSVTTFTVNAPGAGTILASAPTKSTGTVTVASAYCVAPNQGISVNGVGLTNNGTASKGTITIGTDPGTGNTINVGAGGTNPGNIQYVWHSSVAFCNGIDFCVVHSGNTTTDATNLASAINGSCAGNACAANPYVTAAPSTNTVVITSRCSGTSATTEADNSANVTFAATPAGTNGTTSGANFAIGATNNATATNIAAAVTAQTGTDLATAAAATNVVTVTANVAGTSASIPLALNGAPTGVTVSGSSLTGGTNGLSDGTHYSYWSGSTYDTASELATSLATSINLNGTVSGNVTATDNSPGSGQLTIAADTSGTVGNGYSVTSTAFFTGGGNFGGGVAGGSLPGVFPAKFSVSSASSVNCSNAAQPDYVVYPTGVAGSASSATIVAYDNLYATTCSGAVPSVYWAYNTGTGSVVTSPILSYDGTKVAFFETSATSGAVLRVVKFNAGAGTDSSVPASFTPGADSFTNTIAGAGGNTAWASCSTASCMISVGFQTATNPDTNSSPFYDFDNDVLYVGDDSGSLHKFSGVFKGTPAEVTTNWPVTLSGKLTSPVIDPSTGSIFVGSADGTLWRVTTPLTVPGKVQSGAIAAGKGIVDSPIVDSTQATPVVYVFVGDDATTGTNTPHSAVYQFATNFGATTTGAVKTMGNTTGSTTLTVYDGDFDNAHYTGSTGSLYFCAGSATAANPTLYKITLNSTFTSSGVAAIDPLATSPATCSPATEFYNSGSGGSLTTLTASAATGTSTGLRTSVDNAVTTIPVNLVTNFTTNNWALVDSEYMLITGSATNGGSGQRLFVTRSPSNAAAHSTTPPTTVFEYTGGGIITTNGTGVNVVSGTGFQIGDYIQVDSEIMKVTGVAGNALTVARGALSTTATIHVPSSNVSIPALDWLFVSVTANGNDVVCAGACLYGFYIGGATPATATSGLAAAGGTSGIIIDNGFAADGASQVYYTTLSSQACSGQDGTGPVGAGSGGCAIQASQSGLN